MPLAEICNTLNTVIFRYFFEVANYSTLGHKLRFTATESAEHNHCGTDKGLNGAEVGIKHVSAELTVM